MKIGIRHWNSGPGETRRYNRCSSLRLRVRVVVGMGALLVCIRGPLCFGSPSPRPADCVEEVSTAKTDVPFELYNDNLIIVKATIGSSTRGRARVLSARKWPTDLKYAERQRRCKR